MSKRGSLPWLKLWTEARNDGKLRCLSDYQHRVWFRLLCYVAEQEPAGSVRAPWKVLAAECADGDIDGFKSAVAEMESLQLVTLVTGVTCNENVIEIVFQSFAKRQAKYPSDAKERVAERVAKCRENKRLRQSPSRVTSSNESVTSGNAQEEEEEEEKKTPRRSPNGGGVNGFALPDWIPAKLWANWIKGRKKKPTAEALELAVKKLAKLRDDGYSPTDVLENSIAFGYTGLFPPSGPRNGNGAAPKAQQPMEYYDHEAHIRKALER